jgi:hypothetical protein
VSTEGIDTVKLSSNGTRKLLLENFKLARSHWTSIFSISFRRCLVKWQLKRTSKPWSCEICDSKIQWPASETLKLVELLSELSEKKPPPPQPTPRQIALAARAERRRASRDQPTKWNLLKQAMSTRCVIAARSFRSVGKSIFLPGTRQQRGTGSISNEEQETAVTEL